MMGLALKSIVKDVSKDITARHLVKLKKNDWICLFCRNLCVCAFCRRKRGENVPKKVFKKKRSRESSPDSLTFRKRKKVKRESLSDDSVTSPPISPVDSLDCENNYPMEDREKKISLKIIKNK